MFVEIVIVSTCKR